MAVTVKHTLVVSALTQAEYDDALARLRAWAGHPPVLTIEEDTSIKRITVTYADDLVTL